MLLSTHVVRESGLPYAGFLDITRKWKAWIASKYIIFSSWTSQHHLAGYLKEARIGFWCEVRVNQELQSPYPIHSVINRPRVAGAVLQTPLSRTDSFSWFINWFSLLLKNLQNILTPKPWEFESWNFERIFTPYNMSHVRCHVSGVACPMSDMIFFWQCGGASRWRVCYPSLPRLVVTKVKSSYRIILVK